MSESVIRLVGTSPRMEGVRGKTIEGARNMTAKVLCKRHNEMLSPIDKLAGEFGQRLRSFFPKMPGSEHVGGDEMLLFHGDDIGRIMLKFLCASEAGSVFGAAHRTSPTWTPPREWLGILFEDEAWPDGWGLHIPVMRAGDMPRAHAISFDRRVTDSGEPIGGELVVAGLHFLLLMRAAALDKDWADSRFLSVLPQPARMVVHVGGARKTVEFGWDTERQRATVNHRIRA